jgi:hypothetical protein
MAQTSLNSTGVASSGSLVLQTNGTTSAVTVDTSQNVGVGVTPSAWGSGRRSLSVAGSTANYFVGANANPTVFGTNSFHDGSDNKYIANGYANLYLQSSGQHLWYNAASGTAGNAITFTQAMTLDASGNLLVGTTTPVGKLTVYDANNRTEATSQFSITGSGYTGVHFLDATAYYIGQNSNSREVRIYSGSSTAVGVRLTAGNNAWQTYSDERMKDIIEPIENAAQKVSTLRTVIGKYKTDAIDVRRVFMIAQDVQAVLPEAVTTDAEGMLGMAYDHIVPLLTAAIQEQQALIKSLTDRLTALEGAAK